MSENALSGLFHMPSISAAAMAAYQEGRNAASNQQYEDAIRYYDEALEFEGPPNVFKARILEYRGQCHWLLGEFDQAEADYRRSLELSADSDQVARARVRLGEITDFRGNYAEAARIYRQALQEALAAENLLVIGRARRGLGIISRRQGNTEEALSHLTQALVAFRQAGEVREQARVLTSLGRTRHARGEYQPALSAHQEALTIFQSLNDRWRVVQSLTDIGECHQALYDIENAMAHHEKALSLANEFGANLLKPEIQRNLGVDLIECGRYQDGLNYLEKALTGAVRMNNYEQQALILYNIVRASLRQGQMEAAGTAASDLDGVAEKLDADRYRALAAFARGELLFYRGERKTAVAELNKAMLAAQTSVDRGVLWKLHATMSHVVDNEAIANVHRTIAAEFIRQTAEPLQDPQLKSGFVHAPPVLAALHAAGIDPDKL
ncbi:MAG: tetratricopeptide repeat protein [Anaerolineae bacterium]